MDGTKTLDATFAGLKFKIGDKVRHTSLPPGPSASILTGMTVVEQTVRASGGAPFVMYTVAIAAHNPEEVIHEEFSEQELVQAV